MIINYNQAISTNFMIQLPKVPGLDLYALSVNIPTIQLTSIDVSWQDTRIKVPNNKYIWDDITIQFILDENLYSYEILKKWNYDIRNVEHWQTALRDINIIPLDSNKNIEFSFMAEGAWPNMIGGWQYTSTNSGSEHITFDVTFSYQNLSIKRKKPLEFSIL